MKECSKCGLIKSKQEFNKQKIRKDGLYPFCKICARIEAKNWYYKNQDRAIKNSRLRHIENPEYISNWKKHNKDKVKAQTERRRIRKLSNAQYEITEKELSKLYESSCIYCGSNNRITLDHIIPISRGGTHGIGNIAPACLSCNSSKRDKTITEWRKLKGKSVFV